MAITYKILKDHVVITTEGDFKSHDLNVKFGELVSDPKFTKGLNLLVHDLSTSFVPSSDEIENAAKFLESMLKNFAPKIAVVVNKEVKFGMGRMLENFCEMRKISLRVYKDIEEAQEWLQNSK